MRRTHQCLGKITRGTVTALIIIVLAPCGDMMATLQAATPPEQSTYRSSGFPTPDDARRVVMNLAVGRYVEVELSLGEMVRGYIREIADDHFAVLLDGMAALTDIAYGDVRQLRPIPQLVLRSRVPSLLKIEKIVSGVALVGFFVTAFVQCHNRSC